MPPATSRNEVIVEETTDPKLEIETNEMMLGVLKKLHMSLY